MTTLRDLTDLHGGGDAQLAVYEALVREGQREPEDFTFGGDVDFVMRHTPRALAITDPARRQAGFLAMRQAAMRGAGVELLIVSEAEALRNARGLAERLVRGG